MAGTSNYPAGYDSLKTTHKDGTNEPILSTDIDAMADATNKIEQTLGLNPHQGTLPTGLFTTVVARLNALDNPGINTQTGATYTLQLSDFSNIVNMSSASPQTFTIPPHSAVALPARAAITIRQDGVGQVSWAPGAGVTVNCRGGATHIAGQYGYIVALQSQIDTWDIIGDVA